MLDDSSITRLQQGYFPRIFSNFSEQLFKLTCPSASFRIEKNNYLGWDQVDIIKNK